MKKQKNQFSHLTAIERVYLSVPTNFLLDKNLLQGKVLDFGCGLGNDVKLLQKKNLILQVMILIIFHNTQKKNLTQ